MRGGNHSWVAAITNADISSAEAENHETTPGRFPFHSRTSGIVVIFPVSKNGGGEGSRTPVRNVFHAGIYTFIRRSGVSENFGPPAASAFLETC